LLAGEAGDEAAAANLPPGFEPAVHAQETKIRVDNRVVSPGYFRALGVPLIAGRYFDERDRENSANAVIVNEAFARELFPTGDAIGRRVTVELSPRWSGEIVGVVGSYRELSLTEGPRREMFTAYSQTTVPGATLVIRTKGDPAAYARAARAAIATVDPGVPVFNEKTMEQQVKEWSGPARMRSVVLGAFAMIALALASAGVYGIIGCAVAERRQEIGIRMALGARPGEVRRMVMAEGLKLTAWGLAAGALGSIAAGRMMEAFLFQVTAADAATHAATVAVFLAAAAAASYGPARRATRVDPLTVLRDL